MKEEIFDTSILQEPVEPLPQSVTQIPYPTHQPVSSIPPESIVDWLLSMPSIPLSLRQQFIAFWEMLPLGNYKEEDIRILKVKFKGMILDMLMTIPDKEWNEILKFRAEATNEQELEMDINTLFDMLELAFHIQLTRGRKGFTAKLIAGHPLSEKEEKEKGFSIF